MYVIHNILFCRYNLNMSDLPILSITIILPLLSAFFITMFIGHSKSSKRQIYAMYVAILGSIMTLIATIYLLFSIKPNIAGYQFIEKYNWLDLIGLEFYLGVDGFSVYFIVITALLTLICIIASLFTIKKYIKEFLLCFLLLESFCIGFFSSLNLLLFFIFFEATLIPMYLIIGIWGGENRIYAAIKFFLYTFFGSMFFLIALIYIYIIAGTFSMPELVVILPHKLSGNLQQILWIATFVSFAIKVPIPPFHTWLPDAHVQAPTAGSVMLAGILLKLGGYALLRISIPMFPKASILFADIVLVISGITVIYASLLAFAQSDMKKMIAYSSIAHMGYVTGGLFSLTTKGISGAVFQMISHAIISSALFLIVGILYERGHTKDISKYGGVAVQMPVLATLFMITMLGSIGMPGLSGFIGEFVSIAGIFQANPQAAILCALGMVLGAIYMLKLYRYVMFGTASDKKIMDFNDLYLYEKASLLPLVILIIYLGIMPNNVLDNLNTWWIKDLHISTQISS